MGVWLGFSGILGFLFCLILTIVLLVRKKPAKKSTIGIAVSLIVMVIGFAITPEPATISLTAHKSVIAEFEAVKAEYAQYKKDTENLIDIVEAERDTAVAKANGAKEAPAADNLIVKELEIKISKLEAENKTLMEKIQKPQEVSLQETETPPSSSSSSRQYTFGSGNYLSGTDFEAGTYDILAISGSGNVSSSNMFTGGINAAMGDDPSLGELGDLFEKEYKNIKLPKGVELSVSGGVKIKLTKKR